MAEHPYRHLPRRPMRLAVASALILVTAGLNPLPAGAAADAPVTIMAAGDIAGGLADAGSTGDLIREAGPSAVLALGDNAYQNGASTDYTANYDPAWGSFKAQTHPVPGNHEYVTTGAAGYLGYFGAAAVTNPDDGGLYYAWDVGNGWRAYALNTEISTSGAQLTWLRADLAQHPSMHYLLYTHHPRFTSGSTHPPSTAVCPLWNELASTGGLEIALFGHNHQYERFVPMDCAGQASDAGVPSFVVGTGGGGHYPFGAMQPGSAFGDAVDFGVLRLVLHTTSFDWAFLASGRGGVGAAAKGTVLDSGTASTDGTGPPVNRAPTVSAGSAQTVTLPAAAALSGTVTDDGLPDPPAAVTTTWSVWSGPGTVTFGNAAATRTTASFSAAGSYVLQLAATDSAATSTATVPVTVQAAPVSTRTAEVRVAAGSDDAEQKVGGSTTLTSTDLELIADGSTQQVVGIRFPGVQIPAGATVQAAWVQFQVDEVSTGASSLTIKGETAVNPPTYTSGKGTVTARAVAGSVAWPAATWPTVGAAGAAQRTPDLSPLVQAAVNRVGWAAGNALAFQISGSGRRTAEAYEGSRSGAPLLHVQFTAP